MFKTVTAMSLALAVAAGPALAGGLAPVVESQPVVIDEAAVAPRATTGVLVPLLLLGALVMIAASSDDDDGDGGNAKKGRGTGGDGDGGDDGDDNEQPVDPGKDWDAYCAANPGYNGPEC